MSTWQNPPLAGKKIATADIAKMSDSAIVRMVESAWKEHYHGHYRSYSSCGKSWRDLLKLDVVKSPLVVLDFGAGWGLDALSYARSGHYVIAADYVEDNLRAVSRVLNAYGHYNHGTLKVRLKPPVLWPLELLRGVSVFHANGSLHHSIHAESILSDAATVMNPGSEFRLLLYTDRLFKVATGNRPVYGDVRDETHYQRYLWFTNAQGTHSDWYDIDKLKKILPKNVELESWTHLGPDEGFAIAVARKVA